MIFAAGFGTRMAPLTQTRPKPLIEVAGKRLIDHALLPAREAGLAPICINVHYRARQMRDALRGEESISILEETPDILETGGGLKAALPHLPGNAVFTMNSDAVWEGPNPFECLRAAWGAPEIEALLLCVPAARALGRADAGDFTISPDFRVSRGAGYFYTGAQIICRAPVAAHSERIFSFNALWNEMIERGSLFAAIYPGAWCDVGRPSSIALAERMGDV
ncbi:MAG: nucleotidyltransferase family protein [Pseudomonadota bacterium]